MKIDDFDISARLKVVYGGRFSPFHAGHYAVYNWLCDYFPKSSIIVATADNVSKDGKPKNYSKNPFSYEEKAFIAKSLFGIDLTLSENPAFKPFSENEITNEFTYISICGEKDKQRYIGDFFDEININDVGEDVFEFANKLEKYPSKGYFIVSPMMENNISASGIREIFTTENQNKKDAIRKIYKNITDDVFDLLERRINGNSI